MSKMTQKERERWAEIDSVIAEHKNDLKAVETHIELREFAEKQGWDNKSDFPKFKHSLKKIGVNYEALREESSAQREEELSALADELAADALDAEITLWVAAVEADDQRAAFAIVNADHDAMWYGAFFDGDRTRVPGDLVSAEQSVAEKAVWLAGKARAAAGVDKARLEIVTTCPDLDVPVLRIAAARANLALTITADDTDSRAVQMAETPGFQRWQDSDLKSCVAVEEE